ncbi:hypothetical protein QBC39DRAFT_94162 [Podospora conica]|nr:hypothetical protein QBC39DRAFT_94162 [Schizothecium conicum]
MSERRKMTCHPRFTVPSLVRVAVDHPALGSTPFRLVGSPARVQGNCGSPFKPRKPEWPAPCLGRQDVNQGPKPQQPPGVERQLDAWPGRHRRKSRIMGPEEYTIDSEPGTKVRRYSERIQTQTQRRAAIGADLLISALICSKSSVVGFETLLTTRAILRQPPRQPAFWRQGYTERGIPISKLSYDNDISGVWMRRGCRGEIPMPTLARRPWDLFKS